MTTTDKTETESNALDVWFKFENPEDEETEYEANTYKNDDGTFRVEFYHTAVGQVNTRTFPTYEAACIWYEENGYQDFSS